MTCLASGHTSCPSNMNWAPNRLCMCERCMWCVSACVCVCSCLCVCVCVYACVIFCTSCMITLPEYNLNTLCVSTFWWADRFGPVKINGVNTDRSSTQSPMATPMRGTGCMHHHMQITAVMILLPAHSYIALGGEDAIWQVLDGKVTLGRHRDERCHGHLARSTWNVAFYVESTSATTITKHLIYGARSTIICIAPSVGENLARVQI